MESLLQVLMRRDGLSLQEAREQIWEAKKRVAAGEDPEEVMYEEFSLEPDYIWDIMP